MATQIEQASLVGVAETALAPNPALAGPSGCAKSCCTSRTAQSTPVPVPVVRYRQQQLELKREI